MQDDIVESTVRDHGECVLQRYFFSFRWCEDVEIVQFTIPAVKVFSEDVDQRAARWWWTEMICVSESGLWHRRAKKTSPQAKKHRISRSSLYCWDLVAVKGLLSNTNTNNRHGRAKLEWKEAKLKHAKRDLTEWRSCRFWTLCDWLWLMGWRFWGICLFSLSAGYFFAGGFNV